MLRDHFHPPLSRRRPWHALHHAWASALAADLNERLPQGWFAAPNVQFGIEIDVATFEETANEAVATVDENAGAAVPSPWIPGPPTLTLDFPAATDVVEVEVFEEGEELRLAGAIELVSPANKDRPEHRRAFLSKCEYLLRRGCGLAVVDVVTSRATNFHMRLLKRFGVEAARSAKALYATSYAPTVREGHSELDVWEESLSLGLPLPTIPLQLLSGPHVPIHLNETYARACHEQRIV